MYQRHRNHSDNLEMQTLVSRKIIYNIIFKLNWFKVQKDRCIHVTHNKVSNTCLDELILLYYIYVRYFFFSAIWPIYATIYAHITNLEIFCFYYYFISIVMRKEHKEDVIWLPNWQLFTRNHIYVQVHFNRIHTISWRGFRILSTYARYTPLK